MNLLFQIVLHYNLGATYSAVTGQSQIARLVISQGLKKKLIVIVRPSLSLHLSAESKCDRQRRGSTKS
jgi:hypothetical protein